MANINLYIPILKKLEGGFSNDDTDNGGATFAGITLNTFIAYRKYKKLPIPNVEDLKNISDAEWLDVFNTFYWQKWQSDKIINQSIANLLVDFYFNSGTIGIRCPQRLLSLHDDGIVGNATIGAVNTQNQEEFHAQLIKARISFINQLILNHPEQEKFRKGWMNRITSFVFEP